MKIIFKKEHIGQKVTSILHGEGVISGVIEHHLYPIKVSFDGSIKTFRQDGTLFDNSIMPILKFGWGDMPKWDYGEPEFIYNGLELPEEETAWCYVGCFEDEVLCKLYRRLVVASAEGVYISIHAGKTNTQTTDTNCYKYAMRCEDLD